MKLKIIFLFVIVLFAIAANAQDYSGYTKCAEQDSLALVAFYNATDGPNWKSNQDGFSIDDLSGDVLTYYTEDYPNAGMGKWLEGPVKDWFGILLEKQQVGNSTDSVWRVIHLRPTISRRSVGDDNLSGYIPREVGLLTALEWFKVNGNGGLKNTEIPDEIYHPTLEAFDIESAYFKGIISSAIRQCTELSYMNFRYNYLDSVPTFDFLSADQLLNDLWATIWFYDNQISYATLEPTVTYFLSVGDLNFEMRNQLDVGREKEIIVSPGDDVILTCNEAGEYGTYETWKQDGFDRYFSGNTYTINSIAAKDTGAYTTVISNDYIRLADVNTTYNSCVTKPIHVRFTPTNPVVSELATSYSGNEISISFSKPMAVPSSLQASEFTVTSGGESIAVTGISRTGRLNDTYVLELESPVTINEEVTISYTQGTVTCTNGGELQSLSGKTVTNYARVAPLAESAITRTDGSGIYVTFDKYIDPETLIASDFTVSSSNETSVASVVLVDGEIDDDISKIIELVLSESLSDTDDITVSYAHGSLTGLYNGAVLSFENLAVENVIEVNRQEVTFSVEDGTDEIDEIVLYGIKNLATELYDDGTNGDATANDNIFSRTFQLTSGTYTWTVYERTYVTVYDTVRTENADGSISLVVTPSEENVDTLLSEGQELSVTVTDDDYSGTTFFGYKNNTITFILDAGSYAESNSNSDFVPYLMGIDDDWSTGIEMEVCTDVNTPNMYISSVSQYAIDDVIYFNFKIEDTWENSSPQQRSHTVVCSDTIYAEFGEVTAVDNTALSTLKVYPNPVQSEIYLSTSDIEIKMIMINDLTGRCILFDEWNNTSVDVSDLDNGCYILTIIDENDNLINKRFLKTVN